MVNSALSIPLLQTFDELRRLLGDPLLYVVPWQTPVGATYDADVDAWLDGSGDVVTKTPAELTYSAVPALWGADAESLALALGGLQAGGDLVGIARYSYYATFDGCLMVVAGSITGDQYTVTGLEAAPDGSSDVFVVVRLRRRDQ